MGFTDCTTNAERIEYLKGYPIEIDNQPFLDGSKKVGDSSAVSILYSARVRDVRVSPWMDTAAEAENDAKTFLASWDGSI